MIISLGKEIWHINPAPVLVLYRLAKNLCDMNEKQFRCLKRLAWDYNISPEEMYAVITGKASHAGHWDFEHLLVRMLERLSWYDLIELLDRSMLERWLVPDFLSHLRFPEQRVKYERLGKILRGEPVSFTKWGPEYRSEVKDTLFSDRLLKE